MTENNQTPTLSIGGKKNNSKKNQLIIKVIFILLVLFFLLFAFYKLVYVKYKEDKNANEDKEVSMNVEENKTFTLPPPKQFNIVPNEKEEIVTETETGFIGGKKDTSPTKQLSKSVGTLSIKNSQNLQPTTTATNTKAVDGAGQIGTESDMFSNTAFKPNSAKKSIYNPNLLLEQGTYIPCTLRQRLISNVGGQISCTVSENVLSKNGNVILIEKGSKAVGVYQTGAVGHGSDQIFVIWQEIRTPNNINVDVNSGSTDELGANGLTGWTDQHFWKRFGNAILLSMITDSSSALSSRLAKSDNRNYLENTQENSEELAKTVIEQMGDIKPTLYKNQGDKVGIFVARDIDFSNVYSLNKRGQ